MSITIYETKPDTNLCSLENRLWFQILVVPRVLNVGLNPANVLTATESPLLQTLQTQFLMDSFTSEVGKLIIAHNTIFFIFLRYSMIIVSTTTFSMTLFFLRTFLPERILPTIWAAYLNWPVHTVKLCISTSVNDRVGTDQRTQNSRLFQAPC